EVEPLNRQREPFQRRVTLESFRCWRAQTAAEENARAHGVQAFARLTASGWLAARASRYAESVRAPYVFQPPSARTRLSAAWPIRSHREGLSRSCRMRSRIASAFRIGTMNPSSPSVNRSPAPVFAVAITGNPQAIAWP